MPVTLVSFRARFPEFSAIADVTLTVYIDDAIADVDPNIWGDTTTADRAISFLAAHRVASSLDATGAAVTGQAGALASATADGVSSTWVQPEGLSAIDMALWSTVYGQRFLELRNRFLSGPLVVC
jgi:ABC-type branched-subunit amino acid transport system ATPase component